MNVLLIDDDINLCKVLAHQLAQSGYTVKTVNSGREGVDLFRKTPFDIVITDIQMPGITGIEVLNEIRRLDSEVIIVIITAFGTIEDAVEACRLGADDFLTKPFGREQLIFVLEKAARIRRLQKENLRLKTELSDKFRLKNMVVHNTRMNEVAKTVNRLANSDATVLITGESGTGKELIARGIHANSSRKSNPMITVNCPSIPDTLIESELFGHVRGAFTGAIRDHAGKFEQATGGTIFLDEIGDLRPQVQSRLLRVLQEKEIDRVGGTHTIKIDVRVIAATNQDLQAMIRQGHFREDLYYRLCVIPIMLPPLRERKDEIPYLLDAFISRYAAKQKRRYTPELLSALQVYEWPGNVRELENVVEQMVTLSENQMLDKTDLPDHILNQIPENTDTQRSLKEIEIHAIREALRKSNGNQSESARLLHIPRHVLLYRLKKYGIS